MGAGSWGAADTAGCVASDDDEAFGAAGACAGGEAVGDCAAGVAADGLGLVDCPDPAGDVAASLELDVFSGLAVSLAALSGLAVSLA
ncbi:MAG: hypothetical protein HQL74_14720, partial [Magnetococcales bacterium]|nr:hypothetical protein [Magnetococcales bacterium]